MQIHLNATSGSQPFHTSGPVKEQKIFTDR